MQKYNISFKGQNIFVGIDVHLKTWHVTTLTESGYKYSFAQHSDARELFDRLNKENPALPKTTGNGGCLAGGTVEHWTGNLMNFVKKGVEMMWV